MSETLQLTSSQTLTIVSSTPRQGRDRQHHKPLFSFALKAVRNGARKRSQSRRGAAEPPRIAASSRSVSRGAMPLRPRIRTFFGT